MPPSPRSARAARNESTFRELNDQLEASTTGSPSDLRGFVCECADIACTALLAVPLGEYERVRARPEWFLVAPDERHVSRDVEVVVERRDAYWVVEKVGPAGHAAAALDPRS